jgi:hypothetical protein
MAFSSVLVLGPTGGLGQFLLPELIRRKPSFARIGAFIDLTRPQSTEKARILQDYAENGVELVEAFPGDPTPFKGNSALRPCYFLTRKMTLSADFTRIPSRNCLPRKPCDQESAISHRYGSGWRCSPLVSFGVWRRSQDRR